VWFGPSASLRSLSQSNRTDVVGTKVLQPVESVRDIGVYLDSSLTVQTDVAKVTQAGFFRLRRPPQIRRLPSNVTSRLDYCNALLAGLPCSTLALLRRGVVVLPSAEATRH